MADVPTVRGACPFCSMTFGAEPPVRAYTCRECGRSFEAYAILRSGTRVVAAAAGAAEASGQCARHPDNVSRFVCARCGDFVCDVCVMRIEGKISCPKCFDYRHGRGELESARASFSLPVTSMTSGIVALLIGVLGCWGLAVGAIAIVTGILALVRIKKQPGLPGRRKAITGIVTGSLGLVIAVVSIVVQFWVQLRLPG